MATGLRQPNTDGRPLLERRGELRAIDAALARLCAPDDGVPRGRRGGVLAFTGSGGLGKTTLLGQVRARAAAQGCTILSARGGENEQELGFRVVRQLLQPSLAVLDGPARRSFLGSWYDILATALGLEASGATPAPDPAGVRDGLDWVMTQLVMCRAPVVVLLDDMHWADGESLGWLASFAPRTETLPLLLVVACRPEEPQSGTEALRALVDGQSERPHELAPLSEAAVARIVRNQVGEGAEDRFCAECWAVTGGSPFEAVELALRLGQAGLRSTGDELAAMRDLASAVKGPGLLRRLRRLGSTTVRFAWAAAVLGTPAPPDLAAAVAVIGSEDAAAATERLRAARILAADRGGRGVEFVHPLIATAVYRDIPAGLRTGLHNAAAEIVGSAGLGPTAAARHLLEVPREGRPGAVACLREAGREYLRAGAPEAARRVLVRALQEPPPAEERAAILHELGMSTFLIDPAATVRHLREALAEPDVDPDLRASIAFRLAQALAHTDQVAEAAAVVEEEVRRAANPRVRLRMQADHFVWSAFRTDEPDPRARSRRLARLAAKLPGRGLEERYILGLRAWDALVRGEPRDTVLDRAEESLRGGLSWADENRGFEVPVSVALVFMYSDQPGRSEELFAQGIAECERKGWRGSHLALAHALFGYIRYRRGLLTEAETMVREGLRIADRVDGALPAQWFAVGILAQTLLARGRTADARRLVDEYHYSEVVPNAVIYPDPRTVHAELLLAEGRPEAAVRPLGEVGARLEERAWHNPAWCPWRLHLATALAPSDPDRAVRVAREAVALARDFGAASVIGQALRVEAEVTGGPVALGLYAEAVEFLEQSPAAYELARALVGHGAALSRSGRVQEAADRLYQGLERAVHCGAEKLAVRARAELSAAGLRPLPLRYGQTGTLTTRERTAAELTAQGDPVPVVAKELGLTEQGVRQVLSSVYRKLGTDSAGLPRALRNTPRPQD
ncbi:AAA family ATPase [Streptomyces sp. NPDC005876]|uniref:helix-turn-helix transcriptional regulator n=1 Tax=Streptomyces sp. NPDC005876 TaxID=3157076 RepID=UPI0033D54A06